MAQLKKGSTVGGDEIVTIKDLDSAGLGDMTKSTYDTNANGIVDNAEKLGGKLPNQFMKAGPLNWNDLKGE